jgi:hypothetical protein
MKPLTASNLIPFSPRGRPKKLIPKNYFGVSLRHPLKPKTAGFFPI